MIMNKQTYKSLRKFIDSWLQLFMVYFKIKNFKFSGRYFENKGF